MHLTYHKEVGFYRDPQVWCPCYAPVVMLRLVTSRSCIRHTETLVINLPAVHLRTPLQWLMLRLACTPHFGAGDRTRK